MAQYFREWLMEGLFKRDPGALHAARRWRPLPGGTGIASPFALEMALLANHVSPRHSNSPFQA